MNETSTGKENAGARLSTGGIKENLQKFSALLGLILLCICFAVVSPDFLNVQNVMNILSQVSVNCLLSMGVLLTILTGGIDLSVGSILALSSMVMAVCINTFHVSPMLGMLIGAGCGALLGLINGLMLTMLHLPHPFISTLGMQNIARGLALVITGAAPITGFAASVQFLGGSNLGVVPVSILFVLIVAGVFSVFLNRTPTGKHIYAIGGNVEASKLSGINVSKTLILVYTVSGLMAGIGGIVQVGRVDSAFPLAGQNYELNAIAAVIIGGASMLGGSGTVYGTMIGAMIIAVLNNGMNLVGLSSYAQTIAVGVVIIAAVYVDVLRSSINNSSRLHT